MSAMSSRSPELCNTSAISSFVRSHLFISASCVTTIWHLAKRISSPW